MIKILQKKVFKTIPIWLLVILCIGTVFAAFTWISNQIVTYVQVTPAPLTITGAFVDQTHPYIEYVQTFNYTVYGGTNATGFLYITFATSAVTDVLISQVSITPFGTTPMVGSDGTPYPRKTGSIVEHLFYWAPMGGRAFDFGNTNGTITFKTTYNVTGPLSIPATLQVTSTWVG